MRAIFIRYEHLTGNADRVWPIQSVHLTAAQRVAGNLSPEQSPTSNCTEMKPILS